VARAFCANEFVFSGEEDGKLINSVKKIVKNWGNEFEIGYEKNWRNFLKKKKDEGFEIIHLTMYGVPINEVIDEIRNSKKDKVIVVGGAKVPGEIYGIADYNVSITNQPHSEVAALAIFLHEFFKGKELFKEFHGKFKIIPQRKGKKLLRLDV
jgi:tRNA (cytidine56-2'-O)-methyltransferase